MANRDYDQGRGYEDRDRMRDDMGRDGGRGWMDRAREYFDRARDAGRDLYEREYSGADRSGRGSMGYAGGQDYGRGEQYRGGGMPQGGGYSGSVREGSSQGEYGGPGRGYGSMGGNSYAGGRPDLGDRNPSQGFTGGYGDNYASTGGGFGQGGYGRGGSGQGSYYGQGTPGGIPGAGQYGGRQSHAGRGSKNYRRSDARIEEEVHEMLMRHHEIDATDIDVRVENGEVTLSGEVEERRTRRLAEELVEQCGGVRDVHNNLRARRGLMDKIGDALGVTDADRGRNLDDRIVTPGAARDTSATSTTGAAGTGTTAGAASTGIGRSATEPGAR